jgi:chromosome segregation ATPase
MADIQSSSLRSRLGDDVADPSLITRPEGVLSFGQNTSGSQSDSALDLVRQAATLIREKEQQAAGTESRAHTLATRIISELKRAEDRLRAIEAERQATETNAKELNIRVCEPEIALGHAEALIVSTESKLSDAEERTDAAQTRAEEAGTALVRIEEAIRLHLFRAGKGPSSGLSAAA